MAVRKLHIYPDPVLRRQCIPVEHFDSTLSGLIDDLAETMYAHEGVGLAASQIGEFVCALVIDVAQKEGAPHLIELVNPEVVALSEEQSEREEGCLSFPEEMAEVRRPSEVTVKAFDRAGSSFEITGQGLLAVALQHEIDHINGILFVDHISRLKRSLITRRLKKRVKNGSNG
jgi:peptide deformylase